MFTDAIFAIAITLLVLEIPRPTDEEFEDLAGFLSRESSAFLAFALAFLMLWFTWRAHHTLFDQVDRVSQTVLALHVPLLLFAAFLPYATHVWGEAISRDLRGGSLGVALAMFGGTEAILMLCQGALFSLVLGQRLHTAGADLPRMRTSAAVNWGIGLLWGLSAVLAFPLASVTAYLWMATPLVTMAIVLVRRRHRRRGRP
jgi:uncharacterized membrane protein